MRRKMILGKKLLFVACMAALVSGTCDFTTKADENELYEYVGEPLPLPEWEQAEGNVLSEDFLENHISEFSLESGSNEIASGISSIGSSSEKTFYGKLTDHDIENVGAYQTDFSGNWTYTADTPNVTAFWDDLGFYHVISYVIGDGVSKNPVIIQVFNSEFQEVKRLEIANELTFYGNGIYDGTYYYLVFGQTNNTNSDAMVIRVAKYDSTGARVSYCDLSGYESNPVFYWSGDYGGTKIPFRAGNCDLTINQGILACNYAREMYSGHQSNFVFYIDTNTMTRVAGESPYCSHSFDQRAYTTSDGGYIFLDHGDAFYRGFKVSKVNGSRASIGSTYTFHFREGANRDHGYNETYAQLGGLVETRNAYVLCGSSEKTLSLETAPTNTNYCGHSEARNLFIQILKKDFYNYSGAEQYYVQGETRTPVGLKPDESEVETSLYLLGNEVDYGVIWLTDYSADAYVCNPKVVVNSKNQIVLLWEKRFYATYYNSEVFFMILTEDGQIVQEPASLGRIKLTGNVDIVCKGNIVYWTTNDSAGTYIHELNLDEIESVVTSEELAGYSVTLDGTIGLNLYMNLSKNIAEGDCYVLFEYADHEEKSYILDQNEDGYYIFSCPLPAALANQEISATVVYDGTKLSTYQVSVLEYADKILTNAEGNQEYADAQDLVRAMMNYCSYAQIYFDIDTDNLMNASFSGNKQLNPTIDSGQELNLSYEISDYVKSGAGSTLYGISLTCESALSCNLYYQELQGPNYFQNCNFYCSPIYANYSSKLVSDGLLKCSIEGIPIAELDSSLYIDLYFYDESGYRDEVYGSINPMAYVALGVKSTNKKLANLCKSIYWYNQAANAYFQ